MLVLTVASALASIAAIVAELSSTLSGGARQPTQLVLAITTIVLSWAFIHTMFALHYAHEFYDDEGGGGLTFPGPDEEPDYWDFMYFSFVIGMTSQVSDVGITEQADPAHRRRPRRRVVRVQCRAARPDGEYRRERDIVSTATTLFTLEDLMSARAETLAKQFETKAAEMTSTLEKLTDADWKKTTGGEKWTVGVAAHHVASSHEAIAGILKTVGGGKPMTPFTMDQLNEGNAKHADGVRQLHQGRNPRPPQEGRGGGRLGGTRPLRRRARPERHGVDRHAGDDGATDGRGHPDPPRRGSPRQHPQDDRRLTSRRGQAALGASCEPDEVRRALATRGVREVGRAAAGGEASGYGCPGERERATLRVPRALATWQFELSSLAARRGLSGSGEANCPSAMRYSRRRPAVPPLACASGR